MKNIISILILLISLGCNTNPDPAPKEIKSIEIEFDGRGKDFDRKYNLWTKPLDSIQVNKINQSFPSKASFIGCPSYRPALWRINVYGMDDQDNKKILFSVISTHDHKTSMWDPLTNKCYKNNPIMYYIMDIVKIKEIKEFKGPMKQEDYDKLLEVESSK